MNQSLLFAGKSLNASNSYTDKINNYKSVDLGVYVQQTNDAGSKNKRVWSPYDTRWAQYWDLAKEQADDYIAIQTAGLAEYFRIQNPDSKTGVFTNYETSAGVAYTSQVGATINISFTGTGILFRYWTGPTGGLWKFDLDGGGGANTVYISCWENPGGGRRSVLFEDLPNEPHTLVGTFQGVDPDHVVATPLGGLYASIDYGVGGNGYSTDAKTFYIVGSPNPNYCYERNNVPTNDRSLHYELTFGHWELSYRGTANYPTDDGEWIPKHGAGPSNGAVTFASLSTDRTLKADGGINLWLDNSNGFDLATQADEIILHQVFKGHSWQTPATELADFDLELKFTRNGCEITTTMTTLVSQLIQANYSTMFGPSILFDRALYTGGEFDISLPNVNEPIISPLVWDGNLAMVNKTSVSSTDKSLAAGYRLVNPYEAMNLAASEGQLLFANDITGSGNKIYPLLLNSTSVGIGRSWHSKAYLNFGWIPDAYNVLK